MDKVYETMNAADKYLQSWMGWVYKSFAQGGGDSLFNSDSGERHPEMEKAYARSYPTAVAGRTERFSFNEHDGQFNLEYKIDQALSQHPTEIKVQQRVWYPNGFNVSVSPPGSLEWSNVFDNTLHFFATKSVKHDDVVSIKITRA
jgi:hypothetical protein